MPYKPVDIAIKIILGPCIDDTDFKTREEALTYDQAGMEIDVILEKADGTISTTAVTPTTGGDYDWAHTDQGYYELEIPASGGASYNNDTEGVLHVVGYCTGVLPFRSVAYDIVPIKVYNSLVAGSDNLEVDTIQLGGGAQSATDLKDFADAGYDPATNKVQGVVLVDTTTANSDMRGTDNAALASICTEARLAELDAANLPTDIATVDTVVDGIQTDLDNATDGLGALKALIDTNKTELDGMQGLDGKCTISTDAQDLSATLDVNTKTIEGVDATDQIRDAVVDDATRIDASALNTLSGLTPGNTLADIDDIAGLNNVSSGEVETACGNALTNYDPPTKAEMDNGFAALNDITVADIWTYATRILTAATNITSDGGTIDQTKIANMDQSLSTTESNIRGSDSDDLKDISDEIGIVNAKTTNLPADPASQASVDSSITVAHVTTNAKIDVTDGLITIVDAVVDAIKAKTDNLPTDPADQSLIEAAITAAHAVTDGKVNTIDALVDAIKLKTDNLKDSWNDPTAAAIAIDVMASIIEGTYTLDQVMKLLLSGLGGTSSGGGTATNIYKDTTGAKDRITATVDRRGNRSAVVLDVT